MNRLLFVAIVLLSATLPAQTPAFDAVSIRTNTSGSFSGGVGPTPGGGIRATNASLQGMILWAYQLNGLELIGGPQWLDQDRFDIVATASGEPDYQRTLAMTRAMIEERFQLKLRKEMRRLPVYALTVARPDGRLGPSLRPSAVDCVTAWCGSKISGGVVDSTAVTMADFAKTHADRVGRIIVDRTGLNGKYDVTLRYNPDPGGPRSTPDFPAFFTAVEEQLGLTLTPQNVDVDVFVVVGVQKPTEN
jgi:uncharacterized protein (TIGR03435 family)